MVIKKLIRSLLIVMLFTTSFFVNNTMVHAEGLETGLYLYNGSHDPKDDSDLNTYSKSIDIVQGRHFSIVYVENNGDSITKRVVDKNDEGLTLQDGLSLDYANFDHQFVIASATTGGTYTITYNNYSVSITLPDKMTQGLYIYNGSESPIDDTNVDNYVKTREFSIKQNVRVMFIYVDGSGKKSSPSPANLSANEQLPIIEAEGDHITLNSQDEKNYVVKYKNGDTVTDYSVTLSFRDRGGGGNPDSSLATCNIEGTNYYFGLVDWAGKNDGTETAFMVDYRPFDREEHVLNIPSAFVGTEQLQANNKVASQNIMNLISNVRVSLDESSTIDRSAVQIVHRENKANVFGVNCEWYDIIIDRNYPGKAIFKTEFDIQLGGQTRSLTSFQQYRIIDYSNIEFTLTEEEMNNFEYHFNPDAPGEESKSAYDKLEDLLRARNININREKPQNIVVVLPSGTHEGMYHINEQDFLDVNMSNVIAFVGNNSNEGITTTIKGGFVVKGGRVRFEFLNMEGSDAVSYTDKEGKAYSGKKVGIIAEKENDEGEYVADVPFVDFCKMSNYDYALVSTAKGVIAQCSYNYFENNDYCFYMDCEGKWFSTGADGNSGNIFVNSGKAAVALISTPTNKPFDVKFNKNLFFNNNENAYDFYVEEDGTADNKACYLMMYNYYGKTVNPEGQSVTATNVRSARVNYGKTSNAIVYTNPCLMFPAVYDMNVYRRPDMMGGDDPYSIDGVLGLDRKDGLYSCAMNNNGIVLNGESKDDLTTFEILELNEDGVKQLGGLRNE